MNIRMKKVATLLACTISCAAVGCSIPEKGEDTLQRDDCIGDFKAGEELALNCFKHVEDWCDENAQFAGCEKFVSSDTMQSDASDGGVDAGSMDTEQDAGSSDSDTKAEDIQSDDADGGSHSDADSKGEDGKDATTDDTADAGADDATGDSGSDGDADQPDTFDPCKGKDCDDGNKCTVDSCNKGFCEHEPKKLSCDDGNVCTDDGCDSKTGKCAHLPNTATCTDNDVCTVNDICKGGACSNAGAKTCADDGNVCTTESCDSKKGCVSLPNSASCTDNNSCTNDVCKDGKCSSTKKNCDDGDKCTVDSCNKDSKDGCSYVTKSGCVACTAKNANKVCKTDGNPCITKVFCKDGKCEFGLSDGKCDDGNKCSEESACMSGVCTPKKLIKCDDSNPCTADSCDPKSGCVHIANKLACNDNNPCTVDDICDGGKCTGGAPTVCKDDGNVCTTESCNKDKGCVSLPNSVTCTDNDPCYTNDVCKDGKCTAGSVKKVCDDGDPCTADSCNSKTGKCEADYIGGYCKKCAADKECPAPIYSSCSKQGTCQIANECQQDKDCKDDGNPCTYHQCDTLGPAKYCTTKDSSGCIPYGKYVAACEKGKLVDCDDNNPCTDETCDNNTATCKSVPTNKSAPCDDGNKCTTESCKDLKCTKGLNTVCNDKNPCTNDSCDPKSGCVFLANAATCTDGSACTTGDVCKDKVCTGKKVNCDDGNACTNDACDKVKGCANTANTAKCSDGNACTSTDVCKDGKCIAGASKVCNDESPCTVDSCNSKDGKCVFANKCTKLLAEDFKDCKGANWFNQPTISTTNSTWKIDKVYPGEDGGCTLNFGRQNGGYCPGGLCGGYARLNKPFTVTGCQKVYVHMDINADVRPGTDVDRLVMLFSNAKTFGKCNGDGYKCHGKLIEPLDQCQTKTQKTKGAVVNKPQKMKVWTSGTFIEVPNLGSSEVYLKYRTATCDKTAVGGKKGWAIDNIEVLCFKP